MPTSQARREANKRNCTRSTGPKTETGKKKSRANAYKHGLAGDGIVVPESEREAVEARLAEYQAEMDPKSVLGRDMVREMARLSVRLELASRQMTAAVDERIRHATEAFDDARIEEAERLFDGLADDPRNSLRKLRRMPEGVLRMVAAWEDLKADLNRPEGPEWTAEHLATAARLSGRKPEHAHVLRIGQLSRALEGRDVPLEDQGWADLSASERKPWLVARMVEAIDEQLAELAEHHKTLDFETLALDRAEAGERILIDPSKAETLVRRYESEARRGYHKALKELRQAEGTVASPSEPAKPAPAPAPPRDPLASSRGYVPMAAAPPQTVSGWVPWMVDRPYLDANGQPIRPAPPVKPGG